MDASREIEDPTDWLNTSLSSFLPLDNALRCQVCKDLYDTPMITSCSHTFCSKCIRTCISNDGKCPTCRAAEQASKLRNNFAIEEAVGAFKMARPEAYKIALKDKHDEMEEPRRPGKRRRVVREEGEEGQQVEVGRRQTRSMRSNDSRRTAASTQTDGVVDIEDSEGDDEYVPEDGLVACPICSTRMKEQDVSPHLDGECDGTKKEDKVLRKSRTPLKTQTKPSPSYNNPLRQPSQNKPQERLAELNYTLLNDGQLRKKFSALGIPSTGRKDQLKDRYTAWANIWNANCDSRNPKSKPELLNELRKWERTQGGQAREVEGAGIMKKDFDANAWQTSNRDDFSKLIEQARKKKTTKARDAGETADQGEKEKPAAENDTLASSSIKANGHAPEPMDEGEDKDTHADADGTQPQSPDAYHPYQNNSEALASIREKVSALNANEHVEPVMNAGFKMTDARARTEDAAPPQSSQRTASSSHAVAPRPRPHPPPAALLKQASSLGDHFAEAQDTRRLDMFRVPEDPVSDCEEAH